MDGRCINRALALRIAFRTVAAGLAVAAVAVLSMGLDGLAAASFAFAAALVAGGLGFPEACRSTSGLIKSSAALADANVDVLSVLGGAVAKREAGPGAENYRAVLYAVRLGEAMKLPHQQMRALIKGAFVHDIGNIVLSDDILLKRRRLDEVEFEAVKTHTFHGADIVARSPWLSEAADLVRHHHEKWDGSGYPTGIRGEDIPLPARVFAVCDVFDALTSDRPYRAALDLDKAIDIVLIGRGGHFDPEVIEAFLPIATRLHDSSRALDRVALETTTRDAIFDYLRLPH